jgi:hypothetical protein
LLFALFAIAATARVLHPFSLFLHALSSSLESRQLLLVQLHIGFALGLRTLNALEGRLNQSFFSLTADSELARTATVALSRVVVIFAAASGRVLLNI